MFHLRAEKAPGEIVGYQRGGKGTQKPIVEFTTAAGEKVTFTESTTISGAEILLIPLLLFMLLFKRNKVDQVLTSGVTVLYNRNNPQRARINSIATLYGMQLFLIIVGGGIALSGQPWIRELFAPLVALRTNTEHFIVHMFDGWLR
jgi:hypothetical protein